MALSKKAKTGVAVAAGAIVLTGLVVMASASPKRRKSGEEEEGIDLDALPPQPPSPSSVTVPTTAPIVVNPDAIDEDDEDEVSPGWPQPPVPGPMPAPVLPGEIVMPPLVVTGTGPLPPVEPHLSIPTAGPAPTVEFPPMGPLPIPVPTQPTAAQVQADALSLQLVAELRDAERRTGWKRSYPIVQQWQQEHGRTVDGKFGPKDGLYLAGLVGDVPVVRYWPAKDGPNPKRAVDDYRAGLLTIAQAKPHLAEALQRSAAIERGQSFGPPQGDGGKAPVIV